MVLTDGQVYITLKLQKENLQHMDHTLLIKKSSRTCNLRSIANALNPH